MHDFQILGVGQISLLILDQEMSETKHWTVNFEAYDHYHELSPSEIELVDQAKAAMRQAYAPYSEFKVGAVALLEDGQVVAGNNQENKAYPSGLCAERVVLFHAGAVFSHLKIEKLVVVASGDLIEKDQFVGPCGACRQVMLESKERQNASYEVLLLSQSGKVIRLNCPTDLLPFSF